MFDKTIKAVVGSLETYLVHKNLESHHNVERSYEVYHPSAFGRCLRRMQYQRYAQNGDIECSPPQFEPRTLRIFDTGHSMHDRLGRYFENMGVLRGVWICNNDRCIIDVEGEDKNIKGRRVYGLDNKIGVFKPDSCKCGSKHFEYEEITVEDKVLNFYGHVDGVLDYSKFDHEIYKKYDGVKMLFNHANLPQHPVAVDYKTIASYKYKRLDDDGPAPEYICQLTIYNNLMDLPYGFLLYENKDNSDLKYFKVERNEKLFKAICDQVGMMNELTEKKLLPPPKPEKKTSAECGYCEFKELCHLSGTWTQPAKLDNTRKQFYGEADKILKSIYATYKK